MSAAERPAPQGAPRKGLLGAARRTWAAWRRLSGFFEGSRSALALLAPLSLLAGMAEAALLALIAALALALSQGEDRVASDLGPMTLEADLTTLLIVGVVLAVVRGLLNLWLAYLPAAISAGAMAALRRRLFDSFVGATWTVKSTERDGQFQSLMTTQVSTTAGAIITVGNAITAAIMFSTLVASALAMSLVAALVLAVSSVLLLAAVRPLSRRLRRSAQALSGENIEYAQTVQEIALMAEETQVFGASPEYRETFYADVEKVRAPLLRTRYLAGAVPSIYQSAALLLLVLALAAVSRFDVGDMATLGAVVLLLVRAQSYGQRVQASLTAIDEKVPFMVHLADAIERYEAAAQRDGGAPMPRVERLSLREVSYAYRADTPVLHGVSAEIGMGEAVGIVGPSGAGKSTIVQILLRLREPTSGALEVNGIDAATVARDQWQRQVAYVPQSPQLIWGTVADNIRFFRPHVTDEAIREAARRAHVHDEILSWPKGYDTVIGQRASAVSGGQRQRLCIARALADSPRVLILDEPTSALDVRSEELVQQSIAEIKADMILFLVAHRLSTLAICNRVMVVLDGRIQAFDTHERLLETDEFYRSVSDITRRQALP